jgi:hypothetical protein
MFCRGSRVGCVSQIAPTLSWAGAERQYRARDTGILPVSSSGHRRLLRYSGLTGFTSIAPANHGRGECRHLYPFPRKNVLKRLSLKRNRWRRQQKIRTVDAVVSDLVVTHPIRIRCPANVVGHCASQWVNRVGAEVRRVPFKRRAHFRVGSRPRIIRGEHRAIDSHHMCRHVSVKIIEELTHDILAQRIPRFTSRRARLVGHEPPRANQVR